MDLFQLWDNGGSLGMIRYQGKGNEYVTAWGDANMGEPSAAVTFLAVDMNGDGQTEIVQLTNNATRLGMTIYAAVSGGPAYGVASSVTDVGEGAGNVGFLTVDANGDRKTEIVQMWNNGGKLAMTLYAPSGPEYQRVWASPDVGEGPGNIGFLRVDANGDGKSDIVQLWDNGGKLGMIQYSPNTQGWGYQQTWGSGDVGQGAGSLAFLVGDVNGDGKNEIVQLWNNGGKLGMIVYAPLTTGFGYGVASATGDVGQGSGALGFFAVDANADGKTEILQLWNNGGKLSIIEYAANAQSQFSTAWSSPDVGEGPGAIQFLVPDVNDDGRSDILQLWNNGGKLGMITYTPATTGYGYTPAWGTGDVGQGSGAISWLLGTKMGL